MKRVLIITDAWAPQTNGVVTTLQSVIAMLPTFGVAAEVIHPGLFATWPLPTYPEIRLARNPWWLGRMILARRPDSIHVATEGPLGLWARWLLKRWGVPFTTSLHTKYPEYVNARTGLPVSLGYRFLRWFHCPARATLCATESHRAELERWGLGRLLVWGRGVDAARFHPQNRAPHEHAQLLYVGRVAIEKNVEAFLELPIPGQKIVVGDGPARADLERRYPQAIWRGYRYGADLVAEYAGADVLVFPSRTDTFGLVMLEALACGTPVAAYPVTGPLDVVVPGVTGVLGDDLDTAVRQALLLDRDACRAYAEAQSWQRVAGRLVGVLAEIDWMDVARRRPALRGAGLGA